MKICKNILIQMVCICSLSAQVKNTDKSLKGEWDFHPQKIWEVDQAGDEKFSMPSELRITENGTVVFHDFRLQKSYLLNEEGKFISSFAKQGAKAGEVGRYLNCFTVKDRIVIGEPNKLHFFTLNGKFIKSVPNNLFEKFPLIFLNEDEFLFVTPPSNGKAAIKKIHMAKHDEELFDEFPVVVQKEKEGGGPSFVFLGLTPQVKMGFARKSEKLFYGRSDKYEIYVTDSRGKRITSFGLERKKKTLSEEEKRKYFTNPRRTKEQIETFIAGAPDELTYFMRIQENDGLIYVFAMKKFTRTQKIQQVDIFSPEGRYLYRGFIQFGEDVFFRNTEQIVIRGEDLYVILSDDNNKNSIVKYRISLPPSSTQEENKTSAGYVHIPDISTEKSEKMIDVGGRKLHSYIYGKGSPTVVLVSGFNAPQAYWNSVVPDLAALTTVVTYDRAGYGKSEKGDLPVHGKQTAKDLHILLENLKVPKPYILVGHSYGGRIVRLFSSMYPEDMGGLILEDTSHEDVLAEQMKILKGRDLEMLKEMTSGRRTQSKPKTESDYMFITMGQVRDSDPLPRIPYTVLTAGNRSGAVPPMFSKEAKKTIIELGFKLQKKLVELIPGGKHIIVEGIGHNMHLEKPDVLIDPVIKMVKDIRGGGVKSFKKKER